MAILPEFKFVGIILLALTLASSVNKWFCAYDQGEELKFLGSRLGNFWSVV